MKHGSADTNQSISLSHHSRTVRLGYRPDIDGMRGVAVLAVIANHFNDKLLPGGYLGVDVFFVISGFVILASLAGRETHSFSEFFLGFYARRVRRILPALVLFVIIAGFLACLLIPDPQVTLGIGRRALFGFSNVQFYRQAAQYFSESIKLNPYTHTWSLGVEEQFYLIFPFLVVLSGFARSPLDGRRKLAAVLGVISIVSLGLFIFLYPRDQPAAYFLMPSRFWEMGAGGLLFLAWMGSRQGSESLSAALAAGGLGLLVLAFLLPLKMAVPATILAVFASGLLLLAFREGTIVARILSSPWLVKIGLLSYSLYLWHWGVLAFSRLSIGVNRWTIPFQVLLIFLLAFASYRLIESPLRKSRWSVSHGRTVAIGVSLLIVSSLLLLGFGRGLADPLYLAKFKSDDFIYVQKHMECELMSLNKGRDNWRSCLDRSSNGPHVFVLGDSHASNLVPSLRAAAKQLGYADVRYLTNAMPHPFHTSITRPAAEFWKGSKEYRDWIDGLNRKDVVVFSRAVHPDPALRRSWRDQLKQLATDVPARGATLVLVDDIPKTCGEDDFQRSFIMTAGIGCRIQKSDALAYRQPLTRLLREFSKANREIVYLDPLPELCQGDACFPTHNGKILYVDTSPHFSQSNPEPLASFFSQQFVGKGLARLPQAASSAGRTSSPPSDLSAQP